MKTFYLIYRLSVMMKQITQNCFFIGHKQLISIYFHVLCTDFYHYNTFIAVSELLLFRLFKFLFHLVSDEIYKCSHLMWESSFDSSFSLHYTSF